MCGIAGIFGYGDTAAAVDINELVKVRDVMAARGPDGHGLWLSDDRAVAMAHRRLSIIDLSAGGAQPMVTNDGALAITFNGEIYNYKELRAELEASGQAFASTSDTEVLLHLYRRYGV